MVKKVTKKLRLFDDLTDEERDKLTSDKKEQIKKEVGDYLVNAINDSLDAQTSPVTGGKFKPLSKAYRKVKGSGSADLFLSGDMRSTIQSESFRDGIEVGVFDSDEAQKADNHNKNSSKSKRTPVPLRQFIPYEGKGRRATFDKPIRDQVKQIISEALE